MAPYIEVLGIKESSTASESCFSLTATEEVAFSNKMCSELILTTSRSTMTGLRI
jgi:hypothetical protein